MAEQHDLKRIECPRVLVRLVQWQNTQTQCVSHCIESSDTSPATAMCISAVAFFLPAKHSKPARAAIRQLVQGKQQGLCVQVCGVSDL